MSTQNTLGCPSMSEQTLRRHKTASWPGHMRAAEGPYQLPLGDLFLANSGGNLRRR
jgi:hypothetical protein